MAKIRTSSNVGPLFSLETIFEKWQLFCEKPPKGFEKYFKPGGAPKDTVETGEKKADSSQTKAPTSSTPPSKTQPLSKPPGADTKKNDWNFGMFGPSAGKGGSGGSSSGRPIGGDGNDREKWLLLGALGVVGIIGTLAFMEINYKEIGWKEFVNK